MPILQMNDAVTIAGKHEQLAISKAIEGGKEISVCWFSPYDWFRSYGFEWAKFTNSLTIEEDIYVEYEFKYCEQGLDVTRVMFRLDERELAFSENEFKELCNEMDNRIATWDDLEFCKAWINL